MWVGRLAWLGGALTWAWAREKWPRASPRQSPHIPRPPYGATLTGATPPRARRARPRPPLPALVHSKVRTRRVNHRLGARRRCVPCSQATQFMSAMLASRTANMKGAASLLQACLVPRARSSAVASTRSATGQSVSRGCFAFVAAKSASASRARLRSFVPGLSRAAYDACLKQPAVPSQHASSASGESSRRWCQLEL